MSKCMYTAQGEFVCGKKEVIEGFVNETPNEIEKSSWCQPIKKDFLQTAQKYDCDVSVATTDCKFNFDCKKK